MNRRLLLALFICFCGGAYAQQDAHLTHYSFNHVWLNPAYAGMDPSQSPIFRMTYRNQWLGYTNDFDPNGAGHTEVFSADVPVNPAGGGVGLVIVNDKLPSMRQTSVRLAFSKHVEIGKGKLGIGVQGMFSNVLTGLTAWRPPDGEESIPLDDAIPNQQRNSDGLGDISAGLWYQTDDYYVGASMTNLMEQDYEFTQITQGGTKRHLFLTAGYNIEATYDLIITPMALYKSDFGSTSTSGTSSFELGAKATYQEAYWGGLNFRQGDAISLLLGSSFLSRKELKVGYALDIVAFGTAGKAATSHELMLAYYLPPVVPVPKPIIRTPRYKF